jgi:type I restriction enzyme S subunit
VRIADAIDVTTRTVTIAMQRATNELTLLSEYRRRLISDVVTGKLDVREAVPLAPGEFHATEPLAEVELEGDTEEVLADDFGDVLNEAEA